MASLLKKLWLGEEGQGLSEYALLFVLIALTAVTAMGGLASRVDHVYSDASSHVSAATNNPSLASGGSSNTTQAPDNTWYKSDRNTSKKSTH